MWDYKFTDIENNEIRLGDLTKGKKAVLFVNVASKWGLTVSEYTSLVVLHRKYKE